jgi:hypothetical protein
VQLMIIFSPGLPGNILRDHTFAAVLADRVNGIHSTPEFPAPQLSSTSGAFAETSRAITLFTVVTIRIGMSLGTD